jgi:hypothetical protein
VRRWRAAAEASADVERPLIAAERREWKQDARRAVSWRRSSTARTRPWPKQRHC